MEMAQFSSGWRKKNSLFLNLGINCWNNPFVHRVEWVNKKLINYRRIEFSKGGYG